MFCYQCQETANCSGCTLSGVCGKTPDTAVMQDLLVYVSKLLSTVTTQLRKENKVIDKKINHLITLNLFTTITNANFDKKVIEDRVTETLKVKEELLPKVETFKFFFLFPPGISIVSCQVLVFLQLRIVMCGKHFAVGIYIYSCTFGLFQQFFEVFQVVSADKNTRIVADADIYFGDFGISVAACIRFVQ